MPAVQAVVNDLWRRIVNDARSNYKIVTKGARGVNTYLAPAGLLGGRRFTLHLGGGGRYGEFALS